jgi:hypothetical protein
MVSSSKNGGIMNLKEKYAYVRILQSQYQKAVKKEKGRIIDELVKNVGYHRKYAIGLLAGKKEFDLRKRRLVKRVRISPYAGITDPLKELWFVSNYCCPERLQPFIPELLKVLEANGEIKLTDKQRELLLKVSRATVGKLLSPIRKKLFGKGKSTTKPGSLLKHQIPIRTFASWDKTRPGFLEIDLVALCGETLRGDYINILDMIDISLCWSEIQGFMGKSQYYTTLALDEIKKRLPFKIQGIDSDNDAPFINAHLLRYCEAKQITFTRCRPYRKNDQAHVEQKNYSVVRKYLGYKRYDSQKQLKIINRICSLVSLYHNFFQPVMKLKEKIRIGSRIRRKYDKAKTPYQRLRQSKYISTKTKQKLKQKYQTLNPKQLLKQIVNLTNQL